MMKRAMAVGLAALGIGLWTGGVVQAQDEMGGGAGGEAGGEASVDTGDLGAAVEGEGGAGSLTLPAGGLRIDADLMINLSKDNAFEPVTLGPDVWYGLMENLTAGLVHSNFGTTGFYGTVASFSATGGAFSPGGLCLTGEEGGCPDFYDNVGARVLYQFMSSGDLVVAADGGPIVNSFDPFTLDLRAGVKGRFRAGKIGIEFNPALHFGITERDSRFGQTDSLLIPVSVGYSVTPEVIAGVQSGVRGAISAPGDVGFGDTWSVPLTLGASYQLNANMGLGAGFTLPYLLVNENLGNIVDPFDVRVLDIIFSYQM